MYHVLPGTKDHIVAIRVENFMTYQDYKTFLPYLKNRIQEQGMIHILIEVNNFKGVKIPGLIKTVPFSLKYGKYISKQAIVTDEAWAYTWIRIFSPFSKTKMRCFSSSQLEQAWDWIRT